MSSIISASVSENRAPTRWLRLLAIGACCALVATIAWFQWNSREVLLRKGDAEALMLSKSLAQHASDTFEFIDVLLTTLAGRAPTVDRSLEAIYALDESLEAQVRQVPRIRSLIAFDENGKQFASSQPQVPDWYDVSDTEMFRFHIATFGDAVHIGAPVKSPSTHDWLLTVSRRWNRADGRFGGIVVATIRVDYFADFYRNFNVNGEAGIGLLRKDGVMLARYPKSEANLGRNFSDLPWFASTRNAPSGTVRFVSPVDGVARVYGFRSLDAAPLLMLVGISERSVLAGWPHAFALSIAAACLLAAVLAVVGWKLAAQLDIRRRSEHELSRLAMTDGLTGLKNRRTFDALIQHEWRGAEVMNKPLSLILLDVDHFKRFNDTYGHPAGDVCLRAIASVLDQSHRPGDCIARYGGEEFALLLPDTGFAGALVVAERVRQAVLALAIEHKASETLPVVTVSLGIATHHPGHVVSAGNIATLIERADRALYRAKLGGRNRTDAIALTEPLELRKTG